MKFAEILRCDRRSARLRAPLSARTRLEGTGTVGRGRRTQLARELGSPAELAAAEQDYFASVLGQGAAAGGAYPHAGFIRIPRLNPASPIQLKPGAAEEITLMIGGARSQSGRDGAIAAASLRVQFNAEPAADQVKVSVNGSALPGTKPQGKWLEFPVAPGTLRPGPNVVTVALAPGATGLAWTDLHCAVRPAATAAR